MSEVTICAACGYPVGSFKCEKHRARGTGGHRAPAEAPACPACGERFERPLDLGRHAKQSHGASLAELRARS